jgi:hypothetical protein
MMLIEFPQRRGAPRLFSEVSAGLERRVDHALRALGDLPDDIESPGLNDLADALIAMADAMAGDPDLEPEEDLDGEDEGLPLFEYAALRP